MTPKRDTDVVRERDGDRDRNGVIGASGDEKVEVLRGSWDRDRDGVRNRDRGRETESSRDIDRDRRVGSRSSGGEREQTRQFSADRFRLDNDVDAADLRNKEVFGYDERRPLGRDRGRDYDDDERQPMGRDRGRSYGDDERRLMGRGRDMDRGYDDDGEERRLMGRGRGRDYDGDERQPTGRDRGRSHGDDERRLMGRGRDMDRDYDDDREERRPMGRVRGRDYDDDERQPMGRDRGRYIGNDDRQPMGRGRDRDRDYDDDDDEERRLMGRDGDRGGEYDRRTMGRGRGRGWGGRGRGDNDRPLAPPLYSILRATVHSIRPFGIFVQMEGYRNHGLVHLSQVSDHEVTKRDDSEEAKVKALSSVANEGEEVWIKVISVKVEEDGSTKIGCSMKFVSQGNGTDLDPNNIQAEKQQSRPSWKEPQKFKLEAVYNVQCERCGGHGHLKKECYSSGEKTYKLLSDDEDAELAVQNLTKIEGRLPRESSKHTQPPKPTSGVSNHLLATGAVGRGRAVVQPAWMKHGIGVGGSAPPLADTEQKPVLALPEKMETVEDALAVIAMLKEEKYRRKEERHRKKEKRHRSKDEKKDKHKKRHRSEDERHGSRRKHRDVETSDEDGPRERKKHRDVETSDEDGPRERKKRRDEKVSKERKKRRDVEESDGDDYKEHKKHREVDDGKENYKKYHDDDYKERRSSHSKHRD